MTDALVSGAIERLFWHNVRTSGIGNRLQVLKGDSRDILPTLPAHSVDIVFIDGDHRYEYVKADILNAMRLLRTGGVICGDDLGKQLNEVVDVQYCKDAIKAGRQHTLDSDGIGYHPGVTLAIAEVFGSVETFDTRFWVVRFPS